MAFVKGQTKKVKMLFSIRAKAAAPAARKKELKKFLAEVRKLAKKFRGSAKPSK